MNNLNQLTRQTQKLLQYDFSQINNKKQNLNKIKLQIQKKMIFERTTEQLNSWKNEMKDYEKGKRTKKPFGKSMPHTSHTSNHDIIARQSKFNPVLQTFKHKEDEQKADSMQEITRVRSLMNHIKNVQKYEKNYDIVNLYQNNGAKPEQKAFTKKLGPIRNAYNVINNQKLPEYYFRNRDMQLPQERQKNLLDNHKKDFDIISGNYKENNEERLYKEHQNQNEEVMRKYWKTHNYDPVGGKFYDLMKQEEYIKELRHQQKQHCKDDANKYPPSYIYRQPLILDFQKPLPQALLTLDEKEHNKKKKHQLKYLIQDEYEQRNIQDEEKHENVLKNKVHDGRLLDQKAKQFDIITNGNYPQNRVENLYGKKPKINNWEDYIRPIDKQPRSVIKSSGFS